MNERITSSGQVHQNIYNHKICTRQMAFGLKVWLQLRIQLNGRFYAFLSYRCTSLGIKDTIDFHQEKIAPNYISEHQLKYCPTFAPYTLCL